MIKNLQSKGTLESEELQKIREFNESKNEARRRREEKEKEIEKERHDVDSDSSSSEDEETEGAKKEE